MPLRPRDFLALGRWAAQAADRKKAGGILLLDVRRLSSLTDYVLLLSVESSPHLQAVFDIVEERLKQESGLFPVHREGAGTERWAVLDYGGLVVHLFHRSAREFYGLERLWEGAKEMAWEEKAPARPARRPRKTKRQFRQRKGHV